jgi:hypothetical protein
VNRSGDRKGFFQDSLNLPKYWLFRSWQHWIDLMLSDGKSSPAAAASQRLNLELLS